jgi:hypothetical protein
VTPRRLDPLALIGVALAVLAVGTYLWLVEQKGDGEFEPAVWFLATVGIAVAGVAYRARAVATVRRPVAAAAGAVLVTLGALTPLTMDTSHVGAMLGSVGLLLLAAGCSAILSAGSAPTGRARLVVVGAGALLAVAVAMPSAGYLASHGEGSGGGSGGGGATG